MSEVCSTLNHMTSPAASASAQSQVASEVSPRDSVTETVQLLAARLDPIIASRLAERLHGLEWTNILSELDRVKGRQPGSYSRTDLQSQLRMLTERLGGMGFPFDDGLRRVSSLGSLMRIVRNRWAHLDSFTWLEAWRAADTAHRLLSVFEDDEASSAFDIANRAAVNHLHETGLTPRPPEATANMSSQDSVARSRAKTSVTRVVPGADVMHRGETSSFARLLIGDERVAYEPWPVVVSEDSDVLDQLPKKDAKMQVRALAEEITEAEGPIQIDRLAQLIGRSFGAERLRGRRMKQIQHQIRQCEGIIEDAEHFVWPDRLDPRTWKEFRPNDSGAERSFTDISPVEIRNAARVIAAKHPEWDDEQVQRAVLRAFGRKRLTKQAREHLERALVQ